MGVTLVAACSFQDFEYLQVPDDAEGGTSGSGTSGASGSSGESGSSGTSGKSSGGSAGTSATGGAAGDDETGGEGGASTGGSAGKGGMGGMMGGTGGMGGRGGSAGMGGMGAVGELVNPSFETFSTAGWTIDPPEATTSRYIYVQAPTGSVPAPDGAYELATWHQTDGFVVEIYQRVLGLEDGTYTFSGMFSRGVNNSVYLFARNCGGTDPEPLQIPETSASAFEPFALTGIEVVGGSCEVGVHVDANFNQWMNADQFALELEEPE